MTTKTTYSLEEAAKLCGKQLELVISSNQKEYDNDNFIVRSPDFCGYGDQCPEQAIKNFEYKFTLLSAIEKDIEQVEQSKKATKDFQKLGLGYLLNLYDCYTDNEGNFHVDQDRELDPIEFFDEALGWLNSMSQTVKTAKSMNDMDFLTYIMGQFHDLDRGYDCTIWDGYADKLFPNLKKSVVVIQNQVNDFDTII